MISYPDEPSETVIVVATAETTNLKRISQSGGQTVQRLPAQTFRASLLTQAKGWGAEK